MKNVLDHKFGHEDHRVEMGKLNLRAHIKLQYVYKNPDQCNWPTFFPHFKDWTLWKRNVGPGKNYVNAIGFTYE